jgi:hypothetical protein
MIRHKTRALRGRRSSTKRRATPTTEDSPPPPSTSPTLFPNECHTYLMAKEKKVFTRDTPKYTSFGDEKSDDDDVAYSDVDKINELINALNENNRLIEKQDDLIYEEHDKFVEVEKSLALEIKKNDLLSTELSSCHSSISSLKIANDNLSKLDECHVSSSSIEHVSTCNRCKDFDIDACNDHVSTIIKLNADIAKLNAQLPKTSEIKLNLQ